MLSRYAQRDVSAPKGIAGIAAAGAGNVRYTTFARQTGATPLGDVASASELLAANRCRAGA